MSMSLRDESKVFAHIIVTAKYPRTGTGVLNLFGFMTKANVHQHAHHSTTVHNKLTS